MNRSLEMKTSKRGKSLSRKLAASLAGLGLATLCALAVISTPASASPYDFAGRWMNFDHDSSGITGMVITPSRNGVSIRVFGLCRNQPVCDWNVAQGSLYTTGGNLGGNWGSASWGGFNFSMGRGNWARDANVVTANFDVGYARKFMVLKREGSDSLRLQVFSDYGGRYGRGGTYTESRLQRWGTPSSFGGPSDRGGDRGPDQQYPDRGPDQQYPDGRGH